jgi:hypothetical protein
MMDRIANETTNGVVRRPVMLYAQVSTAVVRM